MGGASRTSIQRRHCDTVADQNFVSAMIYSRRDSLKALAAGLLFAEPARAAAPPPTAITPELIAAARREGKIALYSGLDLPLSEKLAKGFEAKYPGIAVRVERSGAERIFQRIGQEQASRIYAADVVISTDAGHFVAWKRDGFARAIRAAGRGAALCAGRSRCGRDARDALLLAQRARLQHQAGEARGRAESASPTCSIRNGRAGSSRRIPSYSGTILTTTFALSQALGWSFYEKLAAADA